MIVREGEREEGMCNTISMHAVGVYVYVGMYIIMFHTIVSTFLKKKKEFDIKVGQ